ncbi:hypothetical protein [Oribacterium sinus]|nr:hypothetical protein [Oribacterium sinus]
MKKLAPPVREMPGYSPRRGMGSIGDTLQWLKGIKILRLNTIFE